VTGDGNCIYNASSLAVSGDEELALILRALTSIELFLHSSYYSSHPLFTTSMSSEQNSIPFGIFFQLANTFEATDLLDNESKSHSDCIKFEALRNCQTKRWSPFISLMALPSVVGLEIHSFFSGEPATCSGKNIHLLLNSNIKPHQSMLNSFSTPIRVLWTFAGSKMVHRPPVPNHVVPLFIAKCEVSPNSNTSFSL